MRKIFAIAFLAMLALVGFSTAASASTSSYGPLGGLHPCTATSIHCKSDSSFPVLVSLKTPAPVPTPDRTRGPGGNNNGNGNGNGNNGNGNGNNGHNSGGHCWTPQVNGGNQGQWTRPGNNGCGSNSHGNCGCKTQMISFTFPQGRGHVFTETRGGPALQAGEVIVIGGQTFTITWTDGHGHFTLNRTPRGHGRGQAQTVCTGHGGRNHGPVRNVA